MSKFFIDRPVFSTVLSLLIVLAGLVAIFNLPIAQFPEIVPPSVKVTATYQGASAETVAASVAAPIEQQLSGAKHLIYFNSVSANDGTMQLTASFDIGSDQDLAAVDVQNRLAIATPRLPEDVRRQGIPVTKTSTNLVGVVALTSEAGFEGKARLPVYAAVKAAQRGVIRSLAREWGPTGARANCVAPLASTPAMTAAFAHDPAMASRVLARNPLDRLGDAEADIGPVVRFLLSDESRYVNGMTIMADGGSCPIT